MCSSDFCKFPLYSAPVQIWFSSQTTLLIKGTRYISCLFLSSRFQLPARPWKNFKQPIISFLWNQWTPHSHPFDNTESTSHSLWMDVHTITKCNTCIVLYEYTWLICGHLWSRVVCCVFSHSLNLLMRALPHHWVNRKCLKHEARSWRIQILA